MKRRIIGIAVAGMLSLSSLIPGTVSADGGFTDGDYTLYECSYSLVWKGVEISEGTFKSYFDLTRERERHNWKLTVECAQVS